MPVDGRKHHTAPGMSRIPSVSVGIVFGVRRGIPRGRAKLCTARCTTSYTTHYTELSSHRCILFLKSSVYVSSA